jgi:hypothetical protein
MSAFNAGKLDHLINPSTVREFCQISCIERVRRKLRERLVSRKVRSSPVEVKVLMHVAETTLKDLRNFAEHRTMLTERQFKRLGKHLKVHPQSDEIEDESWRGGSEIGRVRFWDCGRVQPLLPLPYAEPQSAASQPSRHSPRKENML